MADKLTDEIKGMARDIAGSSPVMVIGKGLATLGEKVQHGYDTVKREVTKRLPASTKPTTKRKTSSGGRMTKR